MGTVEDAHEVNVAHTELRKTIRWIDGVALGGLAVPGFLYASLGASVAALGAMGAVIVWTISALIGYFQNNLIAELALLFPTRSGGMSIYASEGLKRYWSWAGSFVVWGYWFAWSSAIAVNAVLVGDYLQATVLPHADPRIIGIVMVVALWALNVFGLRPGVFTGWILGLITTVPMLIMILASFFSGRIAIHNLSFTIPGHVAWGSWTGISLVLTWLFIAAWSAYASEMVGTLAPEYHDTVKDTPKALVWASLVSLFFYVLLPLVAVGVVGMKTIQEQPYTAFVPLLQDVLGPWAGWVVLVAVISSLVIAANISTIDGSRALYQMSRDGYTTKLLGKLNKEHIPYVGMTLDLVMNVLLVWFLGTPVAIIAAGSMGYVIAFILMAIAFLLLRRDRPNAPRPLKLKNSWIGVAVGLVVVNLLILVVGAPSYGLTTTLLGIVILLIGVAIYLWRVYVEDRSGKNQANGVSNGMSA